MRSSVYVGLTAIIAFGFHLEGVRTAAAASKAAQTECARAWHSCWDKCEKQKSEACFKQCNETYDICLNVEMPGDAQHRWSRPVGRDMPVFSSQ